MRRLGVVASRLNTMCAEVVAERERIARPDDVDVPDRDAFVAWVATQKAP